MAYRGAISSGKGSPSPLKVHRIQKYTDLATLAFTKNTAWPHWRSAKILTWPPWRSKKNTDLATLAFGKALVIALVQIGLNIWVQTIIESYCKKLKAILKISRSIQTITNIRSLI